MPRKEEYWRNPEYYREWNRKNGGKYRQSGSTVEKNRKRVAKWYAENKEYRQEYNRIYSAEHKGRDDCCCLCGLDIYCLLDAHHLFPGDKKLGNIVVTLCANCHRLEHFKLRNF